MEEMQLVVDSRKAAKKGAARRLRRMGKIPAILYGEGIPKAVSVDAKEWMTKFRNVTSNTIVKLKHDAEEHDVLIKDTQDDILSDRVNHIDFFVIHAGQKLQTQVPIQLEGTPQGILEGGILEHKIKVLEVVCLPKDIPSFFTVDISHLGVGESLHVREIDIPESVEVRTEENLTIVVISHPKLEAEPTLDDAGEEALEGEVSAVDTEEASGE